MKVLMVQRFDLGFVGCAERIWRQAQELARRGHAITLVNYPHPERRTTHPRLRPDYPEGVQGLELDRKSTGFLHNHQSILAELEDCDLLHLWKAYPDTGLPVLWALRKRPTPLHYDWDDLEGGTGGIAERLTGSPNIGRLLSEWERRILNWADTVTAASRELERRCLDGGLPQDRLFSGPVGAVPYEPPEELVRKWQTRLDGNKTLVFLGQMEAEDFPVEVLQGVRQAAGRIKDLILVLVGDGSGRSRLEEEALTLGLSNSVLFAGYLPWEEAQAVLSVADAFLFPLKDDPMSRCKSPLVVVEALSHGVPVIGSRVGEVPRMVGEAGALVSGLDPKHWSDAILSLLEDESRLSVLGASARQSYFESWTWEKSVDRLEEAYRKAIVVYRGS